MPVATQLKVGHVVILDGQLYRVLKLTHITPGKGNAVVQSDLRNLKSGVKTEKRFRSSEHVERAEIMTRMMQFLYESDGVFYFMDAESFEQYEMSRDLINDVRDFLAPEAHYTVDLYEGAPIGIELPPRVTMTIKATDPAQKGGAGKSKDAVCETGLVVKVPLFLVTDDKIIVDTESRTYVERSS